MTPFYCVMFGEKSISEPVLTTDRLYQALWAIAALAKVAPQIEVRLRVIADRNLSSVQVLTVTGGRWLVDGAGAHQEAA